MLYFILYLFFEVMTSSSLIDSIGGFGFFLEILISGVIGLVILTNFKYAVAESLMAFSKGEIDHQEMIAHNIFSLVGAVLLILPGLFTDIIGVLIQFNGIGLMIVKLLFKKNGYNATTKTTYAHTTTKQTKQKGENDVIDVEIIENISSNSSNSRD